MHYKHGTCSVFAKHEDSSTVITACIEDHEFQAKNFWFVYVFLEYNKINYLYIFIEFEGMAVGDPNGL